MRLAAYCRVSTDHEEQLDSLEHQKLFFQEFAALHHHELIRIYADEGISGKQLKKRDCFLQMLADAENGEFEAVAVKDIARFARNTLDFLTAIRTLKRHNVVVLFVTNNMTTYGDSEFTLTIFGAIAQEESINTSKRVRFGKKINAQKGRVPNLVYGYERQGLLSLQIKEEEAAVVRRIFQMVLEGDSMRRIASVLNAEHILTKKGCIWDARNIRRLLQNQLYKGVMLNHRSETKDVLEGTRTALPQTEWFRHSRPEYAIVEEAVFDAAQKEMSRRKAKREREPAAAPARRHSAAHLFSNLLVCADCGGSFSRKRYRRGNGMREFWVCRRRDQGIHLPDGTRCENQSHVDEAALREFVATYLAQAVPDMTGFLQRAEQEYQAKRGKSQQPRQIRTECSRLEKTRERLLTLYTDGIINLEELKKRNEKNEQALRAAQNEFARLTAADKNAEAQTDWIQNTARAVLSLESMTNAELRQIVDRISIGKGECAYLYIKGVEEPVASEETGGLNLYRRGG